MVGALIDSGAIGESTAVGGEYNEDGGEPTPVIGRQQSGRAEVATERKPHRSKGPFRRALTRRY